MGKAKEMLVLQVESLVISLICQLVCHLVKEEYKVDENL